MLNFTRDARSRLDRYLHEVRTYLAGCHAIDPADVERDIMEHLEADLAGTEGAIPRDRLEPILQRLGGPQQWVPEDELPWWRRIASRLTAGPEDWRLIYLAFALFITGVIAAALTTHEQVIPGILGAYFFESATYAICVGVAFCLARAAVAIRNGAALGPERWLIYPPLLAIYVPLTAALLLWPVPLAVIALETLGREGLNEALAPFIDSPLTPGATTAAYIAAAALAVAIWLPILTLALIAKPAAWRTLYRPLANNFTRHTFLAITITLFILSLLITTAATTTTLWLTS